MKKSEYYQSIRVRVDQMLTFADTKTSILLAYTGLLLAVLGNQNEDIKFLIQKTTPFIKCGTILFLALFLLFVALLLFQVGKVLLPKTTNNTQKSISHFTDISDLTLEEYIEKLNDINDKSIKTDIISQVHITSIIANEKFINTKYAVIYTELLTAVWIILIIDIILFSQ